MKTKIARWGGSAAVRIPRMAVETLGLHDGAAVDLQIDGDRLVLRRIAPRYTLEELVAQAEGLSPPEALDDGPVGDEAL
ncbi:MAG: AbrB/MazE/SpoVT family DNA-binding domain-containing protein [Pseudomonadota bacterium]